MSSVTKYEIIEMHHMFNKDPSNSELGQEIITMMMTQRNFKEAADLLQTLFSESIIEEEKVMLIFKQLEGEIDTKRLIQMYEQVLEDCYCKNIHLYLKDVKLARQLCKIITPGSITRKQAMISYERIITQFCFDYESGSKFFKSFRKFEQKCLKMVQTKNVENAQAQQKEIKAIENSIRSLFHRQLKIVSKDIDLIWDEYQQWESNPSEIKKLEDTYKKTSQSTLNQESFERLFRQVSSFQEDALTQMTPLVMLQSIYTKFQDKEIDMAKLINFYELGLELMKSDGEIYELAWTYFRGFLQENTNASIQLKYLRRASKTVAPDIQLFQLILRCVEQAGKDEEYLNKEYDKLVRKLESPLQIQELMKAKVFYSTRRFLQCLEDQDSLKSKIRTQFDNILQYCEKQLSGEEKDLQISDVYRIYAKVEALLFGEVANSHQILEQCVKRHGDQGQNWTTFLSLYCVQPFTSTTRDKYRGVVKRACEFVKDDKAGLILQWVEFETLFGMVDELIKAESKLNLIIAENSENGVEEDMEEEMEEDDMEEESEIVPPPKKKKRTTTQDDQIVEKKNNKRKRSDEEQEAPQKKVKELEEPKIFIDSEKTIFVRNIPVTVSEEDLVKLIENREQILECRFVRNQKNEFKGFAYIDFLNMSEAVIGAKQLNQKLIGQNKLYAAVSKPPRTSKDDSLTLFLNNLPYTVSDDKIRDKFSENPSIHIKEVRIITDDDGKAKGYAYVEFVDQESLQQAQSLMLDKPMIDGRTVYAEHADSLSIIKKKQKLQVILVKNLSFKAKEKHIQDLFEGMELSQILIPRDDHNKPRGFAFVEFTYLKQFQLALEMVNAKVLGRDVQIVKSDREITQSNIKHEKMIPDPEEYKQPKSNVDFRKFL